MLSGSRQFSGSSAIYLLCGISFIIKAIAINIYVLRKCVFLALEANECQIIWAAQASVKDLCCVPENTCSHQCATMIDWCFIRGIMQDAS